MIRDQILANRNQRIHGPTETPCADTAFERDHSDPHTDLLQNCRGESAGLAGLYCGSAAFLICGGSSVASIDLAAMNTTGVLKMAVNNAAKTIRPNLWTCVDEPSHFIRSIWYDPTILKFTPEDFRHQLIFNSDTWQWEPNAVASCPGVFFYRRNECLDPKTFLSDATINWGNHRSRGGGRSVMLPAIRILYHLGIRSVYLLGADFRMDANNTYHFEQKRAPGSVRGNTKTYEKLNHWFSELRPYFEAVDFYVYNCNPSSALTAFEFVEFDAALEQVRGRLANINLGAERTTDLYDTQKPPTPVTTPETSRSTRESKPIIAGDYDANV